MSVIGAAKGCSGKYEVTREIRIMYELNIGDVILTNVPHTSRVRKNVIERITATQYVCGGTRFRKRDLGIVGANMWGPGYGFLPEPAEPAVKAEPVTVEVVAVAETETVAHVTPELTVADHVVVFETESQARQVLETANAYTRTAILVQNLESETYIVGVFKSKKAATEAKKNVAGVGRVFDIVVQPSGCTNKAVSFYNIVMLAHAITGENHDKLVTCEHPYWCDGAKGKLYAKIATTESQPVTQEIPRFRRRDLGIVGAKYLQETRGFLPEVAEVAEVKMQVTTNHVTARNFTKHKGDIYAVIGRIPDTKTYAVRHVRAGDDAVEALTRSIELNHYGVSVDPFICKLTGYGRVNDLFILTPMDPSARPLVEVTISSHRVRHPRGRGWIYFNLPQGFDPKKPYDLYCIDDAMDLEGNDYALEFGDGEDNILDLTRPMRVYGVDMMWGGKRREKVCICRHPDLDECDDDDDGFKPDLKPQPLEPWLHTDNDGYEELYEYPY